MKKLHYLIATAGVVIALLGGCKPKEDKIVAPVTENEVPNGILRTNFLLSVHVIPTSQANARVAGLEGATVTVSQNAKVQTKTVNKDGEAVFENLVPGGYTLYVTKDGYASYNDDGWLEVPENLLQTIPNDSNHEFTISETDFVELPILKGALTGVVFYDDDLLTSTPNIGAAGLVARLEYNTYLQPNVYVATVGADGKFNFVDVPNAEATLVIDGQKNVNGKIVRYSIDDRGVFPRISGLPTNVGTLVAGADQAVLIDKSGTFKFWPRGNFDFISATGVTDIEIEEILPGEVTLDFTSSITDPSEQKIYTGTRANNGIWTFENLPTGKSFQIKFSHVVTVPVNRNNFLIRTASQVYHNNNQSGSVIAGSVSTAPDIQFPKSVTFDNLLGGLTYSVAKNEVKDIGIQVVVE